MDITDPCVLFVAEDAESFNCYRQAFADEGFRVHQVSSGRDALDLAESNPDLFCVAARLGDMPGYELCCRLRSQPGAARTPVIHFSAADDSVAESRAAAICQHAYFSFAVRPEEVLVAARALIDASSAERLLETFLESAPDAIVIIDESGVIVRVNGQMERLFGYARDELLGQPMEGLMPAQFQAAHKIHRAAYFQSPKPRPMGASNNLIGRKKCGSEFPIDVALNVMSARNGRFVAGSIRDMTRQRSLEEELRCQWEQLDIANRRKDEALVAVAHELRSPLNSILTNAHVLAKNSSAGCDPRKIGESVARQSAHMLRVVEDLFDLARIRAGSAELVLADCDLGKVVTEALEICQAGLADGKHRLQVMIPDPAPVIQGDKIRLVQVVVNLVNNAAKFTPEGGQIRIAVQAENGEALILVEDNGVGFSGDSARDLFEPFATADSRQQCGQSGLGLGLAIAQQLVRLHRGTIEASSDGPGKGARFTVRLPCRESERMVGPQVTEGFVE